MNQVRDKAQPAMAATMTPVLRERVRERLREAVKEHFVTGDGAEAYARNVEQCLFDWSAETDETTGARTARFGTYEYKCKQLIYAMHTNGPHLCAKYAPSVLAAVDDACLRGRGPEQDAGPVARTVYASLEEAMEAYHDEDDIDDAERAAIETNATHVCRKCHSTDVAFDLKQTRGADEPMTAFCACRKCGTQWKH